MLLSGRQNSRKATSTPLGDAEHPSRGGGFFSGDWGPLLVNLDTVFLSLRKRLLQTRDRTRQFAAAVVAVGGHILLGVLFMAVVVKGWSCCCCLLWQ